MNGKKRTDLAFERRQCGEEFSEIISKREKQISGVFVKELLISNKGNKATRFVTFISEKLWQKEGEDFDLLTDMLSSELRRIAGISANKKIDSEFSILIAGLGNSDITADALGPETVKKITVTRHLKDADIDIYNKLGSCEISAVAPGVLGQTGIETVEIIRGAVSNSAPDVVIAVDSLAALSFERLGNVIQISDGGISPGSGIGNRRKAIDRETLGVPVISIGVPTVVESSTLVLSVLESAGVKDIDFSIKDILNNGKSFFVTPSESDTITNKLSDIIAESLMKAFAGGHI